MPTSGALSRVGLMKLVSQSDRIAEKRVDVALDNGPCVAANTAETDLSSLSAYVRFRRLCGSVHGCMGGWKRGDEQCRGGTSGGECVVVEWVTKTIIPIFSRFSVDPGVFSRP